MKRVILIFAVVLMGVASVYAQNSDCTRCDGKGYIRCPECNGNPPICQTCKGLGNIICRKCHGDSYTCPVCHGSKYYNNATCWTCKGVGTVRDWKQCDGKGYEPCHEIPKNCFQGNQVCGRCGGINNIPCPDCQR
jgi:DnaJ-class molecular chaperone